VYGPGEEAFQKIIPIAFKRLLQGEPLHLWGTGSEKRCFLYLNDAINAIIAAVNCPQYIKPTNIIGSEQISVKDLLELILSITNKNVQIQAQPSTHTPRDIVADNSKMKQYLATPVTNLRDGLSTEWKYFQSLLNENIF
jgi:UDP-glucose 4-epimerase